MKFKAAVIVAIPVLLIAAAALFYWYIRGQAQPILIDDPVPVSSQPVEQTDDIVIPEITVPVPDGTQQPTQDDALTPETVLPDASTPEVKPDVKDDKQPTSPPKDTPKGGDTNEKGQKWFPGFGWVDDEGEGTHEIAENAGTGEIIGY